MDDVPVAVVRAIYDNLFPEMKEWARSEKVNWFTDIDDMSVQRHENRKDWVLHIRTVDGNQAHFMIRMETLN